MPNERMGVEDAMREITYCEAIREALQQAMEKDQDVFLMGEGVDDPRAIFGSTRGLQETFGKERVFDLPLSENGMTGVMIGAALAGMRPVMTHQRLDFALYAMDQIVNHAAKRCYASAGAQSVPITIRTIIGRGWGQGCQHSQNLQSLFAHIPGLKVVMPSTPYDVKGLLLSAIGDNNPVMFIEYRRLYDEVGEVPEAPYTVPIGKGIIRCVGKDVTLVANSYMVLESLRAKAILEKVGVAVEIVEPRTLKPMDETLILQSVQKTGRLVIADSGSRTCGVAAEIAALVAEKAFSSLKVPIRRVTLPDIPTPTSWVLEKAFYPGPQQIARAVCETMAIPEEIISKEIDLSDAHAPSRKQFVGPF